MPVSWAVDEDVWNKAKASADKTYKRGDDAYWPSVVTIYKNMHGTIKSRSSESIPAHSAPPSQSSAKKSDKDHAPMAQKNSKQADSASSNAQVVRPEEGGVGSGRHKGSGSKKQIPATIKKDLSKSDPLQIGLSNKDDDEAAVARARLALDAINPDKKENPKDIYDPEKSAQRRDDLERATRSKSKKESRSVTGTNWQFLEQAESHSTVKPTRFKTVLIQEGMGNLKDAFYYTRKALESAVSIFEGKKCFSDHPDAIEEQTRPERSVRDIVGHFENIKLEEGSDGAAMLTGELCILPDPAFDWARSLISAAVDYSVKYPQSDFIGLSINANGDAQPMDMDDFKKSFQIPAGAMQKIQNAEAEGISQVRVVNQITDAVSCDMVTSPGAKGKVLELLEGDKKAMKKELDAKQEAMPEDKSSMKDDAPPAKDDKAPPAKDADDKDSDKESEDAEAPAKDGAHDDEEQDKELIAQMIKKYMGAKDGEEEVEESAEKESMEAEMKQHVEKAIEMGVPKEAAMHCAGYHMNQMKQAKESEAKEAEAKKEAGEKPSSEAAKESAAQIARLKGEVAALKETNAKRELADHIEKKLTDGTPRAITKQIREAAAKVKTKEEFNKIHENFMAGYKAAAGSGEGVIQLFVETEKTGPVADSKVGFSDCIND